MHPWVVEAQVVVVMIARMAKGSGVRGIKVELRHDVHRLCVHLLVKQAEVGCPVKIAQVVGLSLACAEDKREQERGGVGGGG